MVSWFRWHLPPDTGCEIQALAVWSRARYLSVTEAPHNTDFHTWMGKKHFFVSSKPPRPGTEPRTTGVKGSGANHYPRVPALWGPWWHRDRLSSFEYVDEYSNLPLGQLKYYFFLWKIQENQKRRHDWLEHYYPDFDSPSADILISELPQCHQLLVLFWSNTNPNLISHLADVISSPQTISAVLRDNLFCRFS